MDRGEPSIRDESLQPPSARGVKNKRSPVLGRGHSPGRHNLHELTMTVHWNSSLTWETTILTTLVKNVAFSYWHHTSLPATASGWGWGLGAGCSTWAGGLPRDLTNAQCRVCCVKHLLIKAVRVWRVGRGKNCCTFVGPDAIVIPLCGSGRPLWCADLTCSDQNDGQVQRAFTTTATINTWRVTQIPDHHVLPAGGTVALRSRCNVHGSQPNSRATEVWLREHCGQRSTRPDAPLGCQRLCESGQGSEVYPHFPRNTKLEDPKRVH